jgi:hypothetical protein
MLGYNTRRIYSNKITSKECKKRKLNTVLNVVFLIRLVRREQFVPFGLGRRICMGETLAR